MENLGSQDMLPAAQTDLTPMSSLPPRTHPDRREPAA